MYAANVYVAALITQEIALRCLLPVFLYGQPYLWCSWSLFNLFFLVNSTMWTTDTDGRCSLTLWRSGSPSPRLCPMQMCILSSLFADNLTTFRDRLCNLDGSLRGVVQAQNIVACLGKPSGKWL